eukprot:scaffold34808_cov38-Phaeocystis_antarctica.AAC.3
MRGASPRRRTPAATCCPEPRLCSGCSRQVSDGRHGSPEVAGHRARQIVPAATSCRAAESRAWHAHQRDATVEVEADPGFWVASRGIHGA